MKQQSGFTLIELIAVIVILGIIAAVAVPRFVDLSTAAESASLKGVAGALSSASALNHANNIANDAGLDADTDTLTTVDSCDAVFDLLDGEGLDTTEYSAAMADSGTWDNEEGTANACEVSKTDVANPEPFTAYAVDAT